MLLGWECSLSICPWLLFICGNVKISLQTRICFEWCMWASQYLWMDYHFSICIHASFCQYSKIWLQAICNWTMLTKIIVEELHCILKLLKIPQDEHYVPIAQNVWSTFYITCVDSSFRFQEGCFFSALCLQISEKDFSQAIKREHHFCEMDQTSSEKCRSYGETVDFTFYSLKGTID